MPFLHITTRIEGHPYDKLLTEKGGTGFPTLMFLDAEGRPLSDRSIPRSVKGFEQALERVQEFQALSEKAEAGDTTAAAQVLTRQLEWGWFPIDEAKRRVEALGKLPAKQKKELDQLLVDLEVKDVLSGVGRDSASRIAAGERFAAMWKDDHVPGGAQEQWSYWLMMADYAESTRDARLFKRIVRAFDDGLPASDQKREALKSLESRQKSIR